MSFFSNLFQNRKPINPEYESLCKNGTELAAKNDYVSAIQVLKDAITLEPTSAKAYRSLGTIMSQQGKYKEALVHFELALKYDPKDAIIYSEIGVAYDNINKFDEALKYYIQGLKLAPKDAILNYNIADSYMRQGDLDKALDLFNTCIKYNPSFAKAHSGIGIIYFRKKDYPKAIEHFESSIKSNPNNAAVLYNLGRAYQCIGDSNKVKLVLEQYLNLADPSDPNDADRINEVRRFLSPAPIVYRSSVSEEQPSGRKSDEKSTIERQADDYVYYRKKALGEYGLPIPGDIEEKAKKEFYEGLSRAQSKLKS